MKSQAIWFTSAVVAVLGGALAVVLSRPIDPMQQPGTSWSRGFLRGQTIRLLESGRYVSSTWCDICEEERSYGSWKVVAAGYELHPESGRPPALLRKVAYRGCTVLLPPGAPASPLPSDTFRREGDQCAAGL